MTMRTPLDILVTHAALKQMVEGDFMQHVPDDLLESSNLVKNVCAKVSIQLSNELDTICSFLGISKRKFIEAAFIEALDKAKAIIETEGVHEHFAELSEHHAARGAKK